MFGKGSTERCLNKFELKDNIISTYTKSEWINESKMLLILDQISEKTKNEKSVLLLDQYDAHKTEKVKEYAKSKNIELIYIPVGMTDKYQPLDVSVNGILKTKMRKSYSNFIANNKNKTYTHAKCIEDMMLNYKSISIKTIKHSFDCLL